MPVKPSTVLSLEAHAWTPYSDQHWPVRGTEFVGSPTIHITDNPHSPTASEENIMLERLRCQQQRHSHCPSLGFIGFWSLSLVAPYMYAFFILDVKVWWLSSMDTSAWSTLYDYGYAWFNFWLFLLPEPFAPYPTVHVTQSDVLSDWVVWRVPGFQKLLCIARGCLIRNFNIIHVKPVSHLILADGHKWIMCSCS